MSMSRHREALRFSQIRNARRVLDMKGRIAAGIIGMPYDQLRKAERADSDTLKAIVEEYLSREGGRLRTIDERRTVLKRLVLPKLGARQIGKVFSNVAQPGQILLGRLLTKRFFGQFQLLI